MRLKTFARLGGLYESLIGTGFLTTGYFIFNKIAENDSLVSKIIDYGVVGMAAIGGAIFVLDGISDIITGLHHYGFTKTYQILSGDKDKEIAKWIEQMKASREKEVYPLRDLSNSLKSFFN